MTSSTNYSSSAVSVVLAGLLFLSGCAATKEEAAKHSDAAVKAPLIAVFPIENLTGSKAPVKEIRRLFIERLRSQGISPLGDEELERFMTHQRLRYIGGVNLETAQALRTETGVGAVLLTTLEHYDETFPPKIALISRLVSTGDSPAILWMDSVGLAGDDSPGILDLGLIEDPARLRDKALGILTASLGQSLSAKGEGFGPGGGKRKFRPKIFYHSLKIRPEKKYIVAVVPFFNRSERKNAGEVVDLHFVRELAGLENLQVIEPGVVREGLLNLRIVMDDGISLANAEALFSILNADLILTGSVLDYQDYRGVVGVPKVDFSTIVIERENRQIIWSSSSHNQGNDGVFFFDRGRINTASAMASEMTKVVLSMLVKE